MANAVFSRQLQRETSSVLEYFPLLNSPALESDEYAVNNTLIMTRTISGIALSLIAMAALYWTCPAVALLVAKYETLAILGSSALSFVPGMIEIWRARSAADRLAAEEYRNQIPSYKATNRLCSSPRAFQYLLDRNENLNKLDSQGTSLASKILSSWNGSSEVRRMLVDTDIDLLAANAEGVNLFMLAVESSNSATLRHILKSRKVQAANINEQDQAAIWKHAQNAHAIQLLCQYGFNIDARDAEGATPLMHWVERDGNLPVCVAALNARANPLLQNLQGAKASQLAPANSLLQSLLLQAEREFGNEPVPLPKEKGLMAWLPWKPLACKDGFSYRADFDALKNRINIVGIAAIALVYFAPMSMLGVTAKILTGVIVISIPLFITELWRSEKEAQRQAVAEYLASSIPSKQSTTTICRSIAAARLLVEHSPRPELLNKIDEKGEPLLGKHEADPEVFKLLVDHGANIFAGTRQNGFSLAVKDSRPDLLAHILDRRLVNIQEMPVELQMKMWSSIGSEQAARFLQQYGFNPDVSDAEGNTPLMRLAQQRNISGEIPLAKIQALLAVGANRLLVNQDGQRARDLAVDPRIAALL